MRRAVSWWLLVLGLAVGMGVTPSQVTGQEVTAGAIPADKLEAFARAHVALDQLRERANAEFADPRNKKSEVQEKLREKLREDVKHNLSAAEFDRFTLAVSADTAQRRAFDARVAQLTSRKSSP
jgi:hypothetical protein